MNDHRFSASGQSASSHPRRLTSLKSTALVTTALLLALAVPAQAQFFWNDERPEPAKVERKKVRRAAQRAPKMAEDAKDKAKPSGPVIIAISIEKQQLKLYDSNGVFAESPVSTGMKGHSTPMGVFSVIGKEVFHRSNIYSGAPMPHMQRITWSGVAMHAGVLPGYPASHGCIRMPANFATRMYGWTSKGARVVITPGETTPEEFSHANLISKKLTLPDPNMPVSSQAALEKPLEKPVMQVAIAPVSTPKADRSSITDIAAAAAPLADLKLASTIGNVRTADATGETPIKIDATDAKTELKDDVKSEMKPPINADEKSDVKIEQKADDKTDGKAKAKNDAAPDVAANKDQARPGDTKPAEKAQVEDKPVAPVIASPATEPQVPGTAAFIGPVKPRTGQIAAFISRKEGKLFVRQNFEPLFDVPVTIAPGDKPLGTHVFTARIDKDNADALRWTVVSLPAPSRVAKRVDDNPRRKKVVSSEPASVPTPSTPAEALDRITIPEAALTRIAGAIGTGGSLVVSDYGLGDETGLGTEFIVTQR